MSTLFGKLLHCCAGSSGCNNQASKSMQNSLPACSRLLRSIFIWAPPRIIPGSDSASWFKTIKHFWFMEWGPRSRVVRLQSRPLGIACCIPHFVFSPSGRQSLVFQLLVICKVSLSVWFVLHLESSVIQCCLVQRRLNEAKSAFQTPWWTRCYNLTLSVNHLHSEEWQTFVAFWVGSTRGQGQNCCLLLGIFWPSWCQCVNGHSHRLDQADCKRARYHHGQEASPRTYLPNCQTN